jgi:hypothetical protein
MVKLTVGVDVGGCFLHLPWGFCVPGTRLSSVVSGRSQELTLADLGHQ